MLRQGEGFKITLPNLQTAPTGQEPSSQCSLTHLTLVLEIFSCEIHSILCDKLQFLLFSAKPKLHKQAWNKNISRKYIFSMLFWRPKFGKNLGVSLSEHCEWGPWTCPGSSNRDNIKQRYSNTLKTGHSNLTHLKTGLFVSAIQMVEPYKNQTVCSS